MGSGVYPDRRGQHVLARDARVLEAFCKGPHEVDPDATDGSLLDGEPGDRGWGFGRIELAPVVGDAQQHAFWREPEVDLDADLAYLRELDLVEFSGEIGDGQYGLVIPLMSQWIEQQQDADVVTSRARAEAEDEHA